MTGDLGTGLVFGLICLFFACAAGYLLFQVVDKNLDAKSACVIYAPLLACWIGIKATLGGPLSPVAWGLAVLAAAWCILVPLRKIAVFRKIEDELSDDRIRLLRESLVKQPDNAPAHFKLGELYEDRGWLREAYQEYASALTLDKHNVRARIRTAELYRKITGKPFPAEDSAPNLRVESGPDAERPRGAGAHSPAPQPPVPPPAFFSSYVPEPTAAPFAGVSASGAGEGGSPLTGPLTDLASAVARHPDNARLHEQMGEELLRLGRPLEAADCYRKALAIDPQNERLRFNMLSLLDTQSESTTLVSTVETQGEVSAEDGVSSATANDRHPAPQDIDPPAFKGD